MLELLDGEVGLIVVVVTHAEVGADVHLIRIERDRLAVPLDGIGVPAGVVVKVPELRARDSVLRIAIHDVAERLHLRFVEDGRCLRARRAARRRGRLGSRLRDRSHSDAATWTPAGFR